MPIRNTEVDTLRALLIVYIVAVIHPMFWLDIGRGTPSTFLLFEMPCIFILSGYSYALSLRNGMKMNSLKDYIIFCVQRAARIILPLLLYSVACLFFLYMTDREEFYGDSTAIRELMLAWANPYSVTRPSTMVLASHLWFIPPFLTVTFLLPLITGAGTVKSFPVWIWMLASVILIKSLDGADPALRTTITYLIWSLFGYALGTGLTISRLDRSVTILIPLLVLFMFGFFKPSSLDMQINKFPPNAIFFLFGVLWASIFISMRSRRISEFLQRLDRSALLQPFKRYGYTIYLWQGLGYTLAIRWGREIGMPSILILAVAVLLTVAMGKIASPAERMRFKSRAARIPLPDYTKTH